MKLSIIIPTFKRKESLLRLLESLKSEINNLTEIIIVEQVENNQQEYKNFAKKNNINLKYFFLQERSTSGGKNIGIKNALGDFVLFLDDDVVVSRKFIQNHLRNYTDNIVVAVCGRVITKGQNIESKNDNTGRVTYFGKFSDGFSSTIKQEIDTVIGCNASWRKNTLKKINGFDENFTENAMREETDLCLRAKKAGYKIIFEPNAVVEHLREPTGGARKTEGRINWYYNFFSNETYFFLKHRPKVVVPIILITRWKWMAKCMFGFGREVSFRSITTPFLGMIDGVRKYKKIY